MSPHDETRAEETASETTDSKKPADAEAKSTAAESPAVEPGAKPAEPSPEASKSEPVAEPRPAEPAAPSGDRTSPAAPLRLAPATKPAHPAAPPSTPPSGSASSATPARSRVRAAQLAHADEQRDLLAALYTFAGVAAACCGMGLAAAAQFSSELVKALEPLGDPRLLGLALVIAGAMLLGLGRVRRALARVGANVERARTETALDRRDLEERIDAATNASAELGAALSALHARLDELTNAASNPEMQTSIFHLAASQDQLSRRLELSMTERFGSLESKWKTASEGWERAQKEQAANLTALGEIVEEELASLHGRVQKVAEAQRSASSEHGAHVEGVARSLAELARDLAARHESALARWNELATAAQRSSEDQAVRVDLVHDAVQQKLDAQGRSVDERLEGLRAGLDERLERMQGEQARELALVAERLQASSAGDTRSLGARLDGLDDSLQRARRELGDDVGALVPRLERRIDERAGETLSAVQSSALAASELQREAHQELREALRTDLEGKLRSQIDDLGARVDAGIEALGARQEAAWSETHERGDAERRESDERATQRFEALQETALRTRAEIGAALASVTPELQQLLSEHASSLRADAREASNVAHEASESLRDAVAALGTRVERVAEALGGSQAAAHEDLADRLQRVRESIAEELGSELARVRESVERAARASDDVATRLASAADDLGTRLAQGIAQIDEAQSAAASELLGRIAADRMQGDLAVQSGLRAIETLVQRLHGDLLAERGAAKPEADASVRANLDALRGAVAALASRVDDASARSTAAADPSAVPSALPRGPSSEGAAPFELLGAGMTSSLEAAHETASSTGGEPRDDELDDRTAG